MSKPQREVRVRHSSQEILLRICLAIGAFSSGLILGTVGGVVVSVVVFIFLAASGPPSFHPAYNILGFRAPILKAKVESLDPAFQPVLSLFEEGFTSIKGADEGSQLCVFWKGKKVVDLAATTRYSLFDDTSISCCFSVGKCITSVAAAMLVDRGLIKYETKVVEIWPEFAANGKSSITFADILRHDSGLHKLPKTNLKAFTSSALKSRGIGSFLAGMKPDFSVSTRNYHVYTRGLLLNEICKRVDPKGRSLSDFMRKEIFETLDIHGEIKVAMTDAELDITHVIDISESPTWWVLLQVFIPWPTGFHRLKAVLITLMSRLRLCFRARRNEHSISTSPGDYTELVLAPKIFNSRVARQVDLPSANIHANARSLATIANELVKPGESLLVKDMRTACAGEVKALHDGLFISSFCNAGWSSIRVEDGMFGWYGVTGSVFAFHPQLQLAIAYQRTNVVGDYSTKHANRILKSIVSCVKTATKRD